MFNTQMALSSPFTNIENVLLISDNLFTRDPVNHAHSGIKSYAEKLMARLLQ